MTQHIRLDLSARPDPVNRLWFRLADGHEPTYTDLFALFRSLSPLSVTLYISIFLSLDLQVEVDGP